MLKKYRGFAVMVLSWRSVLLAMMGLLMVLRIVDVAQAQSLDQKVLSLLQSQCAGLGFNPPVPTSAQLGGNLLAMCSIAGVTSGTPNPIPGSSAVGGGAAAVQSTGVSVLNRALINRLEELRREQEEQEGKQKASAFNWNPLAMVPSQIWGPSNASSTALPQTDTGGGMLSFSGRERWKGLGLYFSGLVEALNRNVTTNQDGYRSNIFGFTAGTDYRMMNNLVVGMAFSYANTHGDFNTGGGNFNINSYSPTIYAAWMPTNRTFVQTVAGYTSDINSVSRAVDVFVDPLDTINLGALMRSARATGFSSSRTSSDVFRFGILTGYDHPIQNITIGPRLGLNWSNTHIPGFSEEGNTGLELRYNDQYVNSLQSVVGLQGSAAFGTSVGVLVPQVNADYIHEYANSQRFIGVQFVQDLRADATKFAFQNDNPARNYFSLGTGLVAVLPHGLQPFLNFRAMVGNSQFTNYAGTFGLRIEL
jgi:uncharacterized protein YhjY with autotransporter beta-barrel domain